MGGALLQCAALDSDISRRSFAAEWLNVADRAILPPFEALLIGGAADGQRHLNIMINQCYKCTWRAPVRNLE
jgi:hypothetical protein